MSNLDDKLREIILSPFKIQTDGTRMLDKQESPIPSQIAQIKQAFADEGYSTFRDRDGSKWLTGQMWYDRFVREYHNKADWISADEEMGDDAEHDVLLCARLAAGIEETV